MGNKQRQSKNFSQQYISQQQSNRNSINIPQRQSIQVNSQILEELDPNINQQENQTISQQKQTNSIKNKTHGAIKQKNFTQLQKIFKLFKMDPHEELSVKGNYWTCMHYAIYFKSDQIVEFLIKIAKKKYPKNYLDIINIETKEGWSPAMLAIIYKSDESLKILFEYGGINVLKKDKKNQSFLDLAIKYHSDVCKNMINKQMKKKLQNGFTPINEEKFSASQSYEDLLEYKQEDQKEQQTKQPLDQKFLEQFRELLVNGQRLPCLICLSNDGYIKYTDCCGQPMHGLCKGDLIIKCPFCNHDTFKLISEVYYPERAFIMPDDQFQPKFNQLS